MKKCSAGHWGCPLCVKDAVMNAKKEGLTHILCVSSGSLCQCPIGDVLELNTIYNTMLITEQQKISDHTLQTHLTTTRLSRTTMNANSHPQHPPPPPVVAHQNKASNPKGGIRKLSFVQKLPSISTKPVIAGSPTVTAVDTTASVTAVALPALPSLPPL